MVFRDISTGIVEYGDNLVSMTANEDVKRGQLVTVGGEDHGVQPSASDGEVAFGFATQTVSSGDQVTVATSGTEVLATAGTGTVSRGDRVASHGATGEEGEVDTAATGDFVVGIALEEGAGDGDDVRVWVDLGGEVN